MNTFQTDLSHVGKGYKGNFVLFPDQAEFVAETKKPDFQSYVSREWRSQWDGGGLSLADTNEQLADGNLSTVAASDAMMAKFEDRMDEMTHSYTTINNVSGGVPNVAAYLAGDPMNMRMRKRVLSPMGPMNVVVDLTSSGSIDALLLQKRGIAILSLVRMLSARRPVTLWVGCAMGRNGSNVDLDAGFIKLDTSPLDLARAAHMITHSSVARGMMYSVLTKMFNGRKSMIPWAFQNFDKYIKASRGIMAEAFGGDDMLYVPPIYTGHEHRKELLDVWREADKWVEEKLNEYGRADHMKEEV